MHAQVREHLQLESLRDLWVVGTENRMVKPDEGPGPSPPAIQRDMLDTGLVQPLRNQSVAVLLLCSPVQPS